MKRDHAAKTALTPREKLKVAYFHEIEGINQHVLAALFEVNIGRINEAILPIRRAAGLGQPDEMVVEDET